MAKQDLQDRARALGVSDEGTVEELEDRIAKAELEGESPDDVEAGDGVASPAENARLEHSVTGTTTRDDRLDAGVPMLPGHAAEPVGPEDALGRGEKRGDYRERVSGNPHQSVPLAGGGQLVTKWVDRETGAEASEGAEGAIEVPVDRTPVSALEAQKPRAADIGDETALKGGVQTDPDFVRSALGVSPEAVAAIEGD